MARYQLDNAALEAMRDIAGDVEEADFVPYACLFDPHTILTKNGELLQIIKITGFTYEAIERSDVDLRQVIRRAVAQSVDTDDYALWFTTIRRKKSLSPDGNFPDGFSSAMHDAWKGRNGWGRKHINELYVTVVRTGQSADITSAKGFVQGLMPARDRNLRNAYLDESAAALNEVMARLLAELAGFGVRRLGVVKREDGRYYGEHLEFLEKLINLEERPMPLAEVGLSDYLTSGEISFAYNAMEVRSAEGERRFGAVLTVKEYKEASRYRIDDLLHLPCEFIATQCLIFTGAERAKKAFRMQYDYLRISGDEALAKESELLNMLHSERDDALSFGEQQTMLFPIANSIKELDDTVKLLREALSKIGIVSVREDIRFEDGYWAMLPANFAFLARLSYINVRHAAGFANIQNYPAGNAAGCPWGPPVTVFYTAAGTPYFFNFHLGEVGHTMLVGPFGSGKYVLLNFLLSESRKYQNRLFYLDARGCAAPFVQAIGGHYYDMNGAREAAHCLSPFSLPDHPSNREFLALWLTTLVDPQGEQLDAQTLGVFKAAVAEVFSGQPQQRNLKSAVRRISQQLPQLEPQLKRWVGEGDLAGFFDHMQESVAPGNGIIGFNLSPLLDSPQLLVPVASYLLHRITMTFDGTPAVLVLDEAWRLLCSPLFASRLGAWLDYVASKNGVVIMTSEEVEDAAEYPYCEELVSKAVTQIYLPNDDPSEAYEESFGLNEDECAYLEAMSAEYRHFMLKRASETIIAELNLGGMDDLLAVLSGNVAHTPEPQAAPLAENQEDTIRPNALSMKYGEG
jgi:type IV secretion system protein VirB4